MQIWDETAEVTADQWTYLMNRKRFYMTSTPDNANERFLQETAEDAIQLATEQVRSGRKDRMYVVEIIAIVERDTPPIKVTKY